MKQGVKGYHTTGVRLVIDEKINKLCGLFHGLLGEYYNDIITGEKFIPPSAQFPPNVIGILESGLSTCFLVHDATFPL